MSSGIRTMQKRMLKKLGFRREPPQKWVIEDGNPVLKTIPKEKRQIENVVTGKTYGLHYPR